MANDIISEVSRLMLSFLSLANREVVRREREALSSVSVLSHRGVSNLPQTNKRRYTVKLSRFFGIFALALLVTVTLGGNLTAQPFFTPASGCKESAVLTTEQFLNPGTGGFTQDRVIPRSGHRR
jgi:hypothetical protein